MDVLPASTLFFLLIILINRQQIAAQYAPGEVCSGTFSGLATGSDGMQLNALINRYSKCRKVEGNLEITFMVKGKTKITDNSSLVNFLNNIVEVTGYVLVSGTFYANLPLRSLKLIRGERLYRPFHPNAAEAINGTCALCIFVNPALISFGFESLTEISSGDICIIGPLSPKFSYINTVNWQDLFSASNTGGDSPPQQLVLKVKSGAKGPCHSTCASGYCFGPSAAECHYPTRLACKSCASRCIRPNMPQAGICCSSHCVGGCVNSTDLGCVSCEKYRDNGRCVSECPRKVIADQHTGLPKVNPNYKVSYAGECLRTCPAHVVDEDGVCLAACLPGNRELENGTCVKCMPGDTCPVYCEGTDIPPRIVTVGSRDYVDGTEIKRFANCTHVTGNIAFTFSSFSNQTSIAINPADLWLLSSVQVVTGYIHIQMERAHNFFTDYSFLRDLRTIHGRYLYEGYALWLSDVTNLRQLALTKLKRIATGNIIVNVAPCDARNVNWSAILSAKSAAYIGPKGCSPSYACPAECNHCWGPSDTMCQFCRNYSIEGRCVSQCPLMSNATTSYYANETSKTCEKCHPECAEGCYGQADDQCAGACRNFKMGKRCVKKCSSSFWWDSERTCHPCSDLCERGCTGPATHVGPGGCEDCFRTIVFHDASLLKMCGNRSTTCETGYATEAKGANANASGVLCLQCQPGCFSCDDAVSCSSCDTARIVHHPYDSALLAKLQIAGYSTSVNESLADSFDQTSQNAYHSALTQLKKFACLGVNGPWRNDSIVPSPFSCPSIPPTFLYRPKMNGSCALQAWPQLDASVFGLFSLSNTSSMPSNYSRETFLAALETDLVATSHLRHCRYGDNLCIQCHPFCAAACTGPTAADCIDCLFARVYEDDSDDSSTGGFFCVDKCPPEKRWRVNETVCSSTMPAEERRKITAIVLAVSVALLAIIVAIVVTITMMRRRARDKLTTRKYEADLAGIELQEPLIETEAKPDMSKLTLIKENELKLGKTIGSGAFGTVFQGLWLPQGARVKIPVAVKVLTEKSTKANAEFMEEVRVMAAVHHPCCIRIAGICMGEQLQLVTPLMAHGSLLDYVRKEKDSITARQLITWSTQIAIGMHYLEERSIVHRDLAARNILVAGHDKVRITDFGLAKLLEVNEDEYRATGGKLPIKWLAIECIKHRSFTHKSDVWAYGVTLWEMYTFGQRPYEETPARMLIDKLEKGDRLQQPDSCTIDLYMCMIKCWYPDPDNRPSFQQLKEEFTKMSREPTRYLAIRNSPSHRRAPDLKQESDDAFSKLITDFDDSTTENFRTMQVDDYLAPLRASQGRDSANSGQFDSYFPSNSRCDSSMPPLYMANFDLPPPPEEGPPSLPTYDYSLASSSGLGEASCGALEAAKQRKARNCDSADVPMSSPDYRYATDPFNLLHYENDESFDSNKSNGIQCANVTASNHHSADSSAYSVARPCEGSKNSICRDDDTSKVATANHSKKDKSG